MKRPRSILNLSDLHINADHKDNYHALEELPKALESYYYKQIDDSIEPFNWKWKPDYIAIPGDIIDGRTANIKASYNKATDILKKLLTTFKLSEERIIAVPGNHDRSIPTENDVKEKLVELGKSYKNLKQNFDDFCGINKNTQIESDFINFHNNDFQLFSDFNKQYQCNQEPVYFEYHFYDPFENSSLKYVSCLKVFHKHKICFLCLNTEWLYTRGEIAAQQELHLCTPIVKSLTDKVRKLEHYTDYTIVALMHRKPDDLHWKTRNHTDIGTYDSLRIVEHFSDIIISGHDHPIRASKPDFIKNSIQHFKLGSPSCSRDENERLPWSISVINVDPISLTIELLTGKYYEESWEFKAEGVFRLRNKFASSDDRQKASKLARNAPIRLKASSSDSEDIKSAIESYFGKGGKWRLTPLFVNDVNETTPVLKEEPIHLVLYSLNANEMDIKKLREKYNEICKREEAKRILHQLVINRVVIDIPKNIDDDD